jgi:hypothetical protein
MSKRSTKWYLAAAAVLLLVPAFSVAQASDNGKGAPVRGRPARPCQTVPDGGSALSYLLGVGLTCFGAMFLRSRASQDPSHS